jgi:hypothetical protein
MGLVAYHTRENHQLKHGALKLKIPLAKKWSRKMKTHNTIKNNHNTNDLGKRTVR